MARPRGGASPFPATRRGRLRSRAPGSQGAAFRNAGALGEARTRRSRGARRRGGVQAARASSRSRSHPRPGSASLFSTHFGTGRRRCRALSQGTARRVARPAPPATGRPRRPDAAPDTPPRAVPGRPLVAFAPRLSRLRTGLAEGAPGIGAAAAAPVAVARLPRSPPRYRRSGQNPARVHGGQTSASCSGPEPRLGPDGEAGADVGGRGASGAPKRCGMPRGGDAGRAKAPAEQDGAGRSAAAREAPAGRGAPERTPPSLSPRRRAVRAAAQDKRGAMRSEASIEPLA